MDKATQDRFERLDALRPVEPKEPSAEAAAQLRIAHALEFIAAQAGVIARKTSEIEAHLATIAAHR
jgi:hypothetical protein